MIHETAIIDKQANLASDVEVGPYCVIGKDVQIDAGCKLHSHVVIKGPTTIGKRNQFFQFCSIGEDPQDKKYHGEASRLEIGDDNHFREACTVHRGTEQGGMLTKVGNDNLIMAAAHIAHDCILHDHIIMANYAALAGHVTIEDYANIAAYSAVHQFSYIGAHSFIARAAMVSKDVLPYVMVTGPEAKVCGLNLVGLKRRQFSKETIVALKKAYKIIFRNSLTVKEILLALQPLAQDYPDIKLLINGLERSERGIVR